MGLAVDAGRLISSSIANDFCIKGLGSNNILFATNSSERLRIDSSGRLLQGKNATKGSTGENIPTYCTEITSNNPNVLEIANDGTGSQSYSALVLSRLSLIHISEPTRH